MIIEIPMRPFPAVRVNGKRGKYAPKAIAYHNLKKKLEPYILPHRREIIESLIDGTYHIQFHFAMAESWSKKKRAEMLGKPMQIRPDTDNCFKSFTDTVFYEQDRNDCEIWNNAYSKHWSDTDKIIFIAD